MINTQVSATPHYRVVLVQEDDPVARRVVRSFSRAALECHRVAGGRAVRDALMRVKPHLILLDSVVDRRANLLLNKIHQQCRVPVFLMTQDDDGAIARLRADAMVDDYVLKPIDPRLLALRVIAYLRRMEPPERVCREHGPTDWLPYGWASCNVCGYRGRLESFAGMPLHRVAGSTFPGNECSDQPVHCRPPVQSCPRCGQMNDIKSAPT